MTLPVIILPKAKEDILDHMAYLDDHGAGLVTKLTEAIEVTLRYLSEFPESGKLRFYYHPRLKNIRQWPVKGFSKLLVFYQFEDSSLVIVRLLHSARDIEGNRCTTGVLPSFIKSL